MNEHDRDVILGLADGSLSGDEATAARARIEADPDLASELAVQMAVRSGLAEAPGVVLSDAERSSLRSTLRDQLHLEDAPAAPPASVRRRIPWWQPVLGVGAVAVFVTAVVVLPGGLDGSDDAAEVASEASIQTTAGDAAGSVEDMDAPPPTFEVLSFSDVDGADLLDATRGATTPEEVADSVEQESEFGERFDIDVASTEACLEELGNELPDGDKTPFGAEPSTSGLLVYFAVLDDDGVESVLTVNLDECRLVDVDE